MLNPNHLRRLAALALPAEAFKEILAILSDIVADDERRREDARKRTEKWRTIRHGDVTDVRRHGDVSVTSPPPSSYLEDLTSREDERKKERRERHGDVTVTQFDEFWELYPNKVGKPAARKAFTTAIRKVTLADLIVGVRRYMVHKPADRQWLNPATFLNQERWADQPAKMDEAPARVDPYAPPPGGKTDEECRREMRGNGKGTAF